MTGALADENPLRIAARQRQDLIGDQAIVDHDIRLLNLLQPLQRQQPGVARPGADQHHFAAVIQRLREQRIGQRLRLLRVVIGQRLRQTIADKQLFPETAAFRAGAVVLFHPFAQRARQRCQLAEMLR